MYTVNPSVSPLLAVYGEAGSAPGSGGLGEEHPRWDGGGTGAGSHSQGGGNVSSHCYHLYLFM